MMKAEMLPKPKVISVRILVTATKTLTHTVNTRLTVPIDILHSVIYDIIQGGQSGRELLRIRILMLLRCSFLSFCYESQCLEILLEEHPHICPILQHILDDTIKIKLSPILLPYCQWFVAVST